MPYKSFLIPVRASETAEHELNKFVRSHGVLVGDGRWTDSLLRPREFVLRDRVQPGLCRDIERTPEMTKHPLPRYQRRLLTISVLLIDISVTAASPPAPTQLTGKVVGIADGDTRTLLVNKTQIKERLEGIDTPERGQPFGRKAGQALAKKDFDQVVQVDDRGKDQYGRTLGIVRLDNRNVNLQLVQEGWAWWYRKYAPKNKELSTAETAVEPTARKGAVSSNECSAS
jgi:endonuclease YncB( thermonuclease family)